MFERGISRGCVLESLMWDRNENKWNAVFAEPSSIKSIDVEMTLEFSDEAD